MHRLQLLLLHGLLGILHRGLDIAHYRAEVPLHADHVAHHGTVHHADIWCFALSAKSRCAEQDQGENGFREVAHGHLQVDERVRKSQTAYFQSASWPIRHLT